MSSITKILQKEKEYEQSSSVIGDASSSSFDDNNNNNANTTTAIATATTTATAFHNIKMNPNDVLCGRGTLVYSHFGNKRYRTNVTEYQQEYMTSTTNIERKDVYSPILARINDSGGGIQQNTNKNSKKKDNWYGNILVKTTRIVRSSKE